MNATGGLKVLVWALLTASATLFVVRLSQVLLRILQARSEGGRHLDGFAQRCWRFFWEILCQAKVIQGRPLMGVAHAFLFWGSAAFCLAEVNHVSAGLGSPLFDRHSSAGLFYFWFVFLFALCCSIALAGLVYRRYVLKPDWLDPISRETNLTLGLLGALLITVLPRWWVSDNSNAGVVLWWLHTLALLGLIPLLPRSKNLHILLSPAALFFQRSGFSELPALKDAADKGMATGQGITRLTALQAYACMECGRCTEQCPAYNTGKELDPRLIALGLNYYLDEHGPHSSKPIIETAVSAKALFECTTCGACETHCPAGIQPLSMILGLRRGAVATNAWKDDYGKQLFENLKQQGNAMGVAERERDRFISWQELPIFDGTQEYCLWLGCMGAFDSRGRAIIAAFAKIMRHIGTSFGVLSKEYCTGDPARRLGSDSITGELADINRKILRHFGARKIVSICPHCVRTIAEDWNQLPAGAGDDGQGVEATIEHHSEFLARYAHLLPAENYGKQVTFHDPCYLGRYRNVYDDPRQVLQRSAELVEAPRTREHSFCCGAGGGLVFLGEETSPRINEARARELAGTGVDMIATACPFCSAVLRDAVPASETPPPVLDIAQIVAQQIRR